MLRNKLQLPPLDKPNNSNSNKNNENNGEPTAKTNSEEEPMNLVRPVPETASKYFAFDYAKEFIKLEDQLSSFVSNITFTSPVAYIYKPLEYAREAHVAFIRKFLRGCKPILLLGLNPGPHGMCQTGIPFGNVETCIEWFGIQTPVNKPEPECPAKPVLGFQYKTQEVSGKRLWTVFRRICKNPEDFFRFAFIYNYCPLAFLQSNGSNVTPSDFKNENREAKKLLEYFCNQALFEIILLLRTETIVAIGKYAETRALDCLKRSNPLDTKVIYLPHPSPLSTKSRNWVDEAEGILRQLGVLDYFKTKNWLVE